MEEVARLVEGLLRKDAYPFAVDEVTLLQTHISLLFFAGDRVYKVKKPVRFDFLDYSTLELRRHFCEEEVRLNRRLAAGVHRGVVPIVRDPSGALRIDVPGDTVEYAVEMVRLPQERMMDRLLGRGEIDNDLLRRVAARLARFHAEAATGPGVDPYGTPEAIARTVAENLASMRCFAPSRLARRLAAGLNGFLASEGTRLRRRVAEGRIRDGHGDLHAGNICVLHDDLVIYDCIEFTPRFRCGDVAAEIAFLAMDLDGRDFRAFSSYLVRAYAEAAADPELPELVPFYKSHRALIRAVVNDLRSQDHDLSAEEREHSRRSALAYLHLAAAYHLPTALVCMCGLPASGKSTIARALSTAVGATLLRSDVVRKHLLHIPETSHWKGDFREGPYTESVTRRTYDHLREEAARHLAGGRSVVVDAAFGRRADRDAFAALAAERGVPFLVVFVETPERVVADRMGARGRDPTEVSDATMEVYRRVRAEFVPPTDAVRVDGTLAPEDSAGLALDRLA